MSATIKITVGYVLQTFVEGKCISQEFIAGDEVCYENERAEPIDEFDHEYQPFIMENPLS
jgi:hypothetical protein